MRWKQVQRRQLEIRRPLDITGPKRWNQGIDGRSYVEVIKGDQPRGQHTTTIKVEEIGNGWLYESMIMRLKLDYSAIEVQEKLKEQGMKDVKVRAGGGLDVVLSFNSVEALKSKTSKLHVWFQDWCEYITEWTVECKGRVYPIRVCEEQIINEVSSCGKEINNKDGEEGVSSNTKKVSKSTAKSKREVEDAEVEDADKDEEVEADKAI
ncbi:hypothetical protein ACSBR2_009048 [Camellia fascicularis]